MLCRLWRSVPQSLEFSPALFACAVLFLVVVSTAWSLSMTDPYMNFPPIRSSPKSTQSQQVENTQDAVYWINLARAQDKGLRFWKTKSHSLIVYNSVSADCINKVISQKGELYLKDSRRLVPHRRLYLKSAWQSQQQPQQQQQDTCESASSSTKKLVQREVQGNPTDDPELPSARKLERSTESLVEKEEPEFQVDLRIEGIAQDVIDEERMEKSKK